MRVSVHFLLVAVFLLASLCEAANPGINRIELRFESKKVTEVIERNTEIRAIATVSHSSSGLLVGAWELATPPSTSATPFFKAINVVQQLLGGAGQIELTSPILPSDLPGIYLIRLRIDRPALPRQGEALRYQVILD